MKSNIEKVRRHYEEYPYPRISLLATVRACDTYALNAIALWGRFNGELPQVTPLRILLAGCGSFSPYPFSIANPDAEIAALDLSGANLRRARLHALLHGCRNILYVRGDLLEPTVAPGPFHLIDAYGVIHHLDDPLEGLMHLRERLAEGGVLRLMVYSRGARREVESARRAFRLLGIRDPATARRVMKSASPESRLGRAFRQLSEARTGAGLADAFLHPCARTFTIDELLEMLDKASLTPLMFAHHGALNGIEAERERLRGLESAGEIGHNYIVYAGRNTKGEAGLSRGSKIFLNPALGGAVERLRMSPLAIDGRLGHDNPLLDRSLRRFLQRFRVRQPVEGLSSEEIERCGPLLAAHYLVLLR